MIILTGASGGIGLEIIEELSKLDNILAIYKNSKPLDIKFENVIFKENLKMQDFSYPTFSNVVFMKETFLKVYQLQ